MVLVFILTFVEKLKLIKMQAIGQLKSKKTVYCTICNDSLKRNLVVNIFQNTPEAIEAGKSELVLKANKPYTCKICKSILKTNP